MPGRSLAAFGVALVAIIVVGVLSFQALRIRSTAAGWINHTAQVEELLHRVIADLADAETGQRGFLLTGDEAYLDPYNASRATLPVEVQALRRLLAGSPEQRRRLDRLGPTVTEKLELMARTIELRRAGQGDAALEIIGSDRGKVKMERIRGVIGEMTSAAQRHLAERTAEWEDAVAWSTYVTFGGAGVLLLTIGMIAWMASRDFRAREAEVWLRRVQVALSQRMQGEQRLEPLGANILRILAESLDARVGAIYVAETGGTLRRVAGHALAASASDTASLRPGDGLTGQAVKENRMLHVREVPHGYLPITSSIGRGEPRQLVIAPASVDGEVQAVTELGFLHDVDAAELEVLERVAESIASAIRTSNDRRRLEELLQETQRQSEELQAQQEELRVGNEELEERGRALQLSQTRLENQQAELEQINAQLEEQTQSLARQRDELARTGTELQRSNTYKSEFLANMSHELRTPLNSSLILAKLLADNRERNLTPEQIKFAQTIYSAGNDLLTLINDILDLSKIEAGKVDVRSEEIPIARVVDELSATFQPVAAERQLGLAATIEDGVPPVIETDPTRLQQILKNLLSNALKFTEHGGVALAIRRAADGGFLFEVRDTGIGIAPDQHEVIFEAFRQADGTTNRKYGGTGLGLSISRDLARLLGGDLVLESTPGRGSTFTLRLPARYVARESAPVARPAMSRPKPVAAPRPIAQPAPAPANTPAIDDRDRLAPGARALLIVEDDLAFARILFDLAHELGFLGLIAQTAEEGLAMAKEHRPSAIVLDIGLPDRSGLSVLDVLKHDPATRHLPVHIMSVEDHSQAALEMGATGYALKPVAREKLVGAIQRLEAKLTQQLRRVLIVEDDARLRESTSHLLGGDGIEIVSVGTAAEALDRLASQTFDCMVLDLTLPDRSGFELLDEMSRQERYGFPPVIVYTGRSVSRDEEQELRRYSQSIIIKGARSPERLLDEVTLFLHQVESELPPDRQRMLRDARDRETVFEDRRILVVEDDVRNIFALSSVLEPKGAKIEIARNGREAVDHLAREPGVDLVLMDIMMPEMDGLQATREIRKQPEHAKLPIIALTAKAMADDRVNCLAAGANDYIAKPLDIDKLLSLARVWIRK